MQYITRNKQAFGLVAREYKKFRGSYAESLYRVLFSLIEKREGGDVSILDLGCGVGNSTEPIVRMAKKLKIDTSVIGCDPDLLMLKEARKSAMKNKLSIKYVEGSAEKLPFNKSTFDIITSGAAFHWFATKKAMSAIRRVLKNNGFFFVFWTQNIEVNAPVIGRELYKKYNWRGIPQKLRNPKQIKKIFVANGFSRVKVVKIPHRETRTISETIGLLKTNSTYALLSDKDKKDFVQEMSKEYRKVLGKKKNILKQEICICYGVK